MTIDGTGNWAASLPPPHPPAANTGQAAADAVRAAWRVPSLEVGGAVYGLSGAYTDSSFLDAVASSRHAMDPVSLSSVFPPTASTVPVADATRYGDQLRRSTEDDLAYA